MNKALIVHRFAVFVEPGGVLVEVGEGVEETTFVEFAIGHGAKGVEIAWATAVDFAAHAKGFAQVNGFHEWRETADIANPTAGDVAGTCFDPFGTNIHFAFAGFWTADG